jgi:hypothetical protein
MNLNANLSKQAIEEFKSIWNNEYGYSLREDLAVSYATKLLNLFSAIYRPIPNHNKLNVEVKKG